MTEDKSAGWAAYYDKLRERPPRRTLITALDRFGTPARTARSSSTSAAAMAVT